MPETILDVKNLIKNYGGEKGIFNISFSVGKGEIVGLLGPNGSGKTTTIDIILNVLKRDSGSISILGKDPSEKNEETMNETNFSAVYAQLPGNLTVWQNLYIFGLLYSVKNLKNKVEDLMKEFDLSEFKNKKAGVLSSGEQSRLSLAKALLNNPKLLLLDEPTASLDPHIARLIREKMKKYVADTGSGVLWTTHNMHEVEEVCDRVYLLYCGKIIMAGDPRKLPAEHGKKNLEELFISLVDDKCLE
jgi:ABC-2 type transport system ATP-binding protein